MEIVPAGPGFAATVRGVALQAVADRPEIYAAIRAALEEYSILILPDQAATDEAQLAFSRCFGPLETTKPGTVGTGTNLVVLTNLDSEGRLVPPDHRQALNAKANQLWHTDSSFKATPALASILSARVIPPHGGETEFASTRLAWERLPRARQAALKDAVIRHSYAHSRGKIAAELMSAEEQTALPPVRWRLTWRNPANGRRALYLASHAYAVEGMTERDGQALLQELIEEATRPGLTYLHRWQAGDVVMWDNRATLHRGRPWPEGFPRLMVRTTISARDADGLASVRPPAVEAAYTIR
jgi:alpha-ketoglutarate-dependent 2,4-dichlorophenoxyacetate dioxygenase